MRRIRAASTFFALVLCLRAGFAQQGPSALEVRVGHGLLSVRAEAVPVAEVLERLSREAGFKLVFEGTRPSQRISLSFDGLPEPEALARVLEGLGLNYALLSDPSGRKPGVLVVSGQAAVTAGGTRLAPVHPVAPAPEPYEDPAPPEEPTADLAGIDPAAPPGPVAPGGYQGSVEVPFTGQPGAPGFPATASGPAPVGSTQPMMPPGSPEQPMPGAPAFPGAPSMPMPPSFPIDASGVSPP
jgi:hypothetical protein